MVATSTPASTPPGGLGPPPVMAAAATAPASAATTPATPATTPATGTALFGTPTNPPVVPPKPIMGGLVINDKGEQEPWTGGQPNVSWTDLDTTAPNMPETPNQLRPMNTYQAQKSYNFRKGGLSNKYSRSDDLALFQSELLERFKDEGMDSITYLPHPKVSKMVSVITHHSCFSLETVRNHVQTYSPLYDNYDKSNDKAARKSFLDSLDTQLKNAISKKCRDDDTFTIVWMIFMKTVTSSSHEKFENLKNQIKARKPTQYSGQDLHQLADHFRDDAKVLETAGCYDHNLTLEMVKIFLSAGGSGEKAEDFRFALREMRAKLDKALTHIKFMSVADQNQYMEDNRFTYQDICEDIESHYQNFKDLGEWLPAKNVPDSKAPPSTFGANLVEDKPLTRADFMTLMHSGFAKKQGVCHECGSEGHWKRECPKLKGNSVNGVSSQGQQRQGRKTSNKRISHSNGKKMTSWKIIPPEAGQPETKTSDTGRVFHWCAKCKRWSPSHGTSGHTGKKKESRSSQEANLCLVPDPSCWKVEVASFTALLTQLIVESPMFLFAMFLGGLAVFLTVGDVAAVIGDIATMWNGFVCFVIDHGPMLGQAASQLWTYSAPFLWLLLFVWSIVWRPRPDPEPDGRNRRERRADCHFNRRRNRPRHKYASIKDYNFHRSYPRHLRERGMFYKRAPQVAERFHQDVNHQLHTASLRVLDSVRKHGKNPMRPRQNERDNGDYVVFQNKEARASRLPRRRPKARSRHTPTYRPIPSSSPAHAQGNRNWTRRQEQAARKIVTQVQMRCFEVQKPSNPATLRMALQAPTRYRSHMPKDSSFPIIWDSGASISVTPHKSDFVGPYTKPPISLKLKGLAKGLNIVGQGHVMWAMPDTNGMLRAIKVPAYHVPDCCARLLSTSSLLQTYKNEHIHINETRLRLSGDETGEPPRGPVIAMVDPSNNLPTSQAYAHSDTNIPVEALNTTITAVSNANHNLSEPEKELLRWHYRLGHCAFRKIQALMRSGVLSHSHASRRLHTSACKIRTCPKCAACQYGKQTRRPAPGKTSSVVQDRSGVLKQDDLFAGQKIAVDHFVCSTEGRLFTSRGRTSKSEMYCGGCMFTDHATGYLHVEFQKHLNTHETLEAKQKFELMCRDHGVVPQAFISDNGSSFTSQGFTGMLKKFAQVISFAGVGAHHHNGTAERAIQTVMNMARTMMLHAAIHWPDVSDATLWPMAVAHAVYLYNHMPNLETGISPVDLFTKTRWEQRKFHDVHVWGCPTYVLDKTLADGKKLPRWKPRSRRSVYMGNSPNHASTVPLVLNPDTGAITPQFHVVFDDWFATVASSEGELPDFQTDEWTKMFGDSTYQYPLDEPDNEAPSASDDCFVERSSRRLNEVARAIQAADPPTPLPTAPPPESVPNDEETSPAATTLDTPFISQPPGATTSLFGAKQTPRERSTPPIASQTPRSVMSPLREPAQQHESSPRREKQQEPKEQSNKPKEQSSKPKQGEIQATRRSVRVPKHPSRHGYDGTQGYGYHTPAFFHALQGQEFTTLDVPEGFVHVNMHTMYNFFGLPFPAACKASVSDPDTLTFDQAMQDVENKGAWIQAMKNEIEQLEQHGTWDEVPITDAKTKILPLTWVLRRKRSPDGEVKKLKARVCIRGDLQEGTFDTFAPVVSWVSVRIFLVLSMTMHWVTCSIDFSNAFVQAKLDEPVWTHLPRGFLAPGRAKTCLRLKKSLYGLAIAPKMWWTYVSKAILDLGLTSSEHDPCLFFKKDLMVVLYVDDAGIAAPNHGLIDEFVEGLKKKGFDLTREGSFSEFLGIKFEEDAKAGTITLTQQGLIKKIIAATGLEDCNPNWTPAAQTALGKDPEGPPMHEDWSYPSIVGMLLYLSTNTRPDICFAVSQVARFNRNPKQSHAQAVKMIVRYLSRTWDKGMIVKPSGDLQIDCYVDADFAGLYRQEPDDSPTSAKSRLGYIISLGGVPLVWKSQLQSEISLSTQESEYSALSQAIRIVLPIRRTLLELVVPIGLNNYIRATVNARVFEDNNGAFLLATGQRITNRTRFYQVKWHHFWDAVKRGDIEVHKIGTLEQRADYLTKGLTRWAFERIRKLNQGW